jgi:hypothetical protein
LSFPIDHSVNSPKPIIPVFHHSNIPIGAKPLSSHVSAGLLLAKPEPSFQIPDKNIIKYINCPKNN